MSPSFSVHWKTGTLLDLNDKISEDQIASKSFCLEKSPEFSPVSGIHRIMTPASGQDLCIQCKAAFDSSLYCQITSGSFCVPWSPEAYAILTIYLLPVNSTQRLQRKLCLSFFRHMHRKALSNQLTKIRRYLHSWMFKFKFKFKYNFATHTI